MSETYPLPMSIFQEKLRVAIIGQSQFAAEVYKQVRSSGHDVVGVFTVPDVGGREDPVAETAKKDGVKESDTSLNAHIYFYVDDENTICPICTDFLRCSSTRPGERRALRCQRSWRNTNRWGRI